MKTRKIIRIGAFVLCLLLLIPIGARVCYVREMNMNFTPEVFAIASKDVKQYSYADAVRDGDPDLEELSRYFIKGVAPIGYPERDYEIRWEVSAPKDLAYYDAIGGKVVHTVAKGSVVNLQYEGNLWKNLGKGCFTLPTTDKRWHLACPLDDPDGKLLYVRVSDYRSLTDAFVRQNPEYFASEKRLTPYRWAMMMTKSDYSHLMTAVIDRQMFSAGIHNSPLAALPLFNGAMLLLPIADALCLGLWLVLFIRRKRA